MGARCSWVVTHGARGRETRLYILEPISLQLQNYICIKVALILKD